MTVDDRRRGSPAPLRRSNWRGHQNIVLLAPSPDRPAPTALDVRDELHLLRRHGVQRVMTSALHPPDLEPFLTNGFVEHERLHLLRHDLVRCPPIRRDVAIRRARRRDREEVLELDGRAFEEFWTLDSEGLDDAIHATPTSRFRVVRPRSSPVVGYSVTGIASRRGYLQRLAVDPTHQGLGYGRALVAEALASLRRAGAGEALVNTQESNGRAFDLYRCCGFVPEAEWLTVLTIDLDSAP